MTKQYKDFLKKNIRNTPSRAFDYQYIVATAIDGELWFYGAYNNDQEEQMKEALKDLGRRVKLCIN